MFLLATVLVFAGCKKEESQDLPPSIRLLDQPGAITTDTTVSAGTLMTFAIQAEGRSSNLTNLIVQVDDGTNIRRYLDTSMNISKFSIRKSFPKSLAEKETWTFIVRDKNRMSESTSLVITKDTTAGYGPVQTYTHLQLSAQNNPDPGSFFSFISGETYSLESAAQHQDLIDLAYYFGQDENTIASPGANIESGIFEGDLTGWSIRRTTRFIELDLPAGIFEAAQNDSLLLASYTEGSGKRKSKNLSPGKTFAFKTEDFKYGIFRVTDVQGTDAGTILIDVKIQDK